MDTNPLAADPPPLIRRRQGSFDLGVIALSTLTDGAVYVTMDPVATLPIADHPRVKPVLFSGAHPAGLPGTHIHHLNPVSLEQVVWTINYQDVMAIGALLESGRLDVTRVVALGGASCEKPRLLQTELGANLSELTQAELVSGEHRVISGSVLSGHCSEAPVDYLGRFHLQVSAIPQGHERVFLGWQRPGLDKFSHKNTFVSKALPFMRFPFSTDAGGSPRAMVPVESFEQVLPFDTEPTFLMRALLTQDGDLATGLGVLDLDEEDLALCTFVCPGKEDYAVLLRQLLTSIERDG